MDNIRPEFLRLLTTHQSRLYAYIMSLVFDPHLADDVLQQTNLVLWQKEQEFQADSNFVAWAFRIAYFEVLAARKQRHRDRLVLDDAMLSEIAAVASKQDEVFEQRQRLLRNCLEKLNSRQRDVIRRRYSLGASTSKIAEEIGKTAHVVKQLLFRARMNLIQCVNLSATLEKASD